MHHYLGLGANNYAAHVAKGRQVKLKKLFYVLRPVFALQWLIDQPERRTPPPMHFPTLMNEIDLSPAIRTRVEGLLALKASTREMGEGPVEPSLDALATGMFERARSSLETMPDEAPPTEARLRADALLRRLVTG
jgi:predicted nucleotidyltransferase